MNTYTITVTDQETSEFLELQLHIPGKVELTPELLGQITEPMLSNYNRQDNGTPKVFLSGTMFKGLVIKELS